jgi:crotonobetainyl-CoA:carnitine CoA-transferase CaiB-like acyl-CoA transferase
MGSVGESTYSVQDEAKSLFEKEILQNPLIPALPQEIKEAGKLVHFSGNAAPSIPINWRFAESVAAMKAFEASMLNVLRSKKYGTKMAEVDVNTDHASLFFMSPFLTQIVDKDGSVKPLNAFKGAEMVQYGFKNWDLHRAAASLHRTLATNIYETKDGRYYHTHGSLNPEPTLTALDLPMDGEEGETYDSAVEKIQAAVKTHDSASLDQLMNEKYKQAGTIAWSKDEFLKSEHGKANSGVSLYDLHKAENYSQSASWWPENQSMPSSAQRPLAGLKVVDLTRIIAAPTITRSLAEMGASVMRVTSSSITDMGGLHQDLNWGKWNCELNLKKNPEDRKALAELIKDADVVVEGYRPGAMARNGFSREDIFELVKDRGRGIIHVRENCYGWNGPWMHRSGWQQISDAVSSILHSRNVGAD